jgi:methylenetetrahydrofolate reductase (NADPH)
MHISDILTSGHTTVSFEFFPPKTPQAQEQLFQTIRQLEALDPAFVSVTYGAGGTTRELTHALVKKIKTETSLEPVPHLTCVGHTREEIAQIVGEYAQAGVGNLLALRGDPPRDSHAYDHAKDVFPNAIDLVKFIREQNVAADPRGFGIGVAGFPEGHPATPNRLQEMDYLKAKVDAGASYICTQLFFDNRDFYDFRERCALAGIDLPVIAGIMPVTSLSSMRRMAELAGGARFPAKLLRALDRARGEAGAVQQIGLHYATEQCSDLLDNGVAGLHFYTLNQSNATREICVRLGLAPAPGAFEYQVKP